MGVIRDAADPLTQAIAKLDISSGRKLEEAIQDLSAFDDAVAHARRAFAARITDEFPADPGVAEMITKHAGVNARLAADNKEVGNHLRRAHQHEWERIENPRTGERAWDTDRNAE